MTTVLSVMTPPIVWPKKRGSVVSGTIIKEQEWAVHIKQHRGRCRPTCMGTAKGEEEENSPRLFSRAGVRGDGVERKVAVRERDN